MKYILIFIYLAISVLLFVLNWDLFTTFLKVDFGFGEFNSLPFLILQIFGIIILGIFAVVDGVKDLKKELKIGELEKTILTMQKDNEIASLKSEVNANKQENIKIVEMPVSPQKEK